MEVGTRQRTGRSVNRLLQYPLIWLIIPQALVTTVEIMKSVQLQDEILR